MKRFMILVFLLLVTLGSNMSFAAPSLTNKIGLRVARVYLAKDDEFDLTTEAGTNIYEYNNQPLKIDDQIRYAWFGSNLNIANVLAPTPGNGYLKIYKNDDSVETNFIKNYGSSPLLIRDIADKLTVGRNTLLLVLVENPAGTSDPATKVQISFDYASETLPPTIDILSPSEKSVFGSGINRDFSLKLNNFFLEKINSSQPNKGFLEVYLNEVKTESLLFSTTTATSRDTFSEVGFSTNDIEKIQNSLDNKASTLLFVLKTSAGVEIASARKTLTVVTNYGGTLDLGLPSVSITSPKNNAEISLSTPIKLEVKNFELLSNLDINTQKPASGYVQVRINDKLIKENTNSTEFTLSSLGVNTLSGVNTIRVDLVNQQFVLLQPSAQASVSVAVKQDSNANNTTSPTVTSSTWRYVILIATVVLILGSIAVLVVKG